jgi:hypothetical protein
VWARARESAARDWARAEIVAAAIGRVRSSVENSTWQGMALAAVVARAWPAETGWWAGEALGR